MDKLMDNPWFIKGLALVLAILLYSSIPHPGNKDVNVPGEQSTETIKDFPVKVYYDTENLVVAGIPDSVDVTLKGPITHIQTVKAMKNFEVFLDLTDVKVGRQKVKFEIKDLSSDKIDAEIKPETVYVTVQEKISKEVKVEVEMNQSLIEEGYTSGAPDIEPKKVKITGAKSEVDRITYVKAVLEGKEKLKETTTSKAKVQVLDKDLNKLNVLVEPETVNITIPVKENSKTVPIHVIRKGTPPAGVTIESIKAEETEAVITGSDEALEKSDSVRVEVDVSRITENTKLNLPVIISNGIIKVSPQMAEITITVNKQEEKTISNIPLNIKGLAENYNAEIEDPANKTITVTINGDREDVNALKPEDFNAYIDVTNLEEGTHELEIQIEGPTNVNWKAETTKAKIIITTNA